MLNEAMPDEQLLVREWLQADAANRKYYEHFKTIWNESKALAANITVDEQAAWQKFKSRIQPATEKKKAGTILLFSPYCNKMIISISHFFGACLHPGYFSFQSSFAALVRYPG